jgi:hypothetical protein
VRKRRKLLGTALGVLLVALGFAANPAEAFYPPDGAKDDGLGGYMIPGDGMCVVGVAANGTMLVDGSITNARDCVAWTKSGDDTVNLVGLNTQAKCLVAGGTGNDGYKHAWSTSICYDTVNSVGVSRIDLDNTAAMCTSKGATVVTTGKCVAYGWVYRNRKADGSLVPTGSGLYTTTGAATTDGLGFCYASMDMTSATYADRETCPSEHNNNPPTLVEVCVDGAIASPATCQNTNNRAWSADLPGCIATNLRTAGTCTGGSLSWVTLAPAAVAPGGEWTACGSNPVFGCQSQSSYDSGLGWTLPDSAALNATTGALSSTVVRVCSNSAYASKAACEANNTGSKVPGDFYWNPDLSICVDTSKTTACSGTNCSTALTCTGGTLSIVFLSDNNRCVYQYGQAGKLAATVVPANSFSAVGIGTTVDLTTSAYDTQGECLAGGFSWDNWLPDIGRTVVTSAEDANLPDGAQIVKLDAITPVKDGGGNFYSGTGAICLKCHSDQSRSYMERNKPGFVETPHKFAGDILGSPWQPNFTAEASPWGLKGVQCSMCHSTARPANDDLIQVVPAGIVGPPAAGAPISATGHNRTEYASHVTDVCFHCHGHFPSANAASVIPIAAGDFALTGKGLAPIGNEFLNSPHAKYTGTTSTKVDIGNKLSYSSRFLGYLCRSSNSIGGGNILTTVYRNGEALKIPALDSTTNPACTNPGDGTATSGAAGFWVKDGEAITGGTPADNAQGSCMTCHDVHWDFESTNPEAEPFRRECTTCHVNPDGSATNAPQINPAAINHLKTKGTPLEHLATRPYESCVICHMPKSSASGSRMHLWRVNPDKDYSTMGASNIVPDGAYANAVWVDVASACGQCHDAAHYVAAGAPHYTTADLALVADGIHDSAGVTYPATFTATPSVLTVSVAASVTCGGTCPTFTYDWNWGDGSVTLDGITSTSSHLYTSGGAKTIVLTVRLSGKKVGSSTRSIMLANPDGVPTAGGTDTWDANAWTMSIVDTSTDDGPDANTAADIPPTLQIVINWGDGTTKTIGAAGQTFTHVYARPGTFTVTLRATDPALHSSTVTFTATPAYFNISGVVQDAGSAGLTGATVKVMRGTTLVKTIVTPAGGAFDSGTILKPGTYTLTVTKAGYTFAKPAATMVVGPSQTGVVINGTAPLALSPLGLSTARTRGAARSAYRAPISR